MATLSSASTLDQVKAAYDDNSGYDVDGNVTECQIFIQACRILLRRLPAETSKEGQSLRIELQRIEEALAQAKVWLATSNTAAAGGGVLYSDFSTFRQ